MTTEDKLPKDFKPERSFVCGFAMNHKLETTIGIKKLRGPAINIGRYTGPGGLIEVGEGIRSAMVREFREETGITTDPVQWYCFHVERYITEADPEQVHRIYYLTCVLDDAPFWNPQQTTDEPLAFLSLLVDRADVVYNFKYLTEMARTFLKLPARQRWIGS